MYDGNNPALTEFIRRYRVEFLSRWYTPPFISDIGEAWGYINNQKSAIVDGKLKYEG